jgi:hypothetical protein
MIPALTEGHNLVDRDKTQIAFSQDRIYLHLGPSPIEVSAGIGLLFRVDYPCLHFTTPQRLLYRNLEFVLATEHLRERADLTRHG